MGTSRLNTCFCNQAKKRKDVPLRARKLKGEVKQKGTSILPRSPHNQNIIRAQWVSLHPRQNILPSNTRRTMLQLNDTVEPESPGAAIIHHAETEEGVEIAFTPPEAGRSLGHGASVACCPPLQTLTPFHVHNPTIQAKVKDYFVFRVSWSYNGFVCFY